MDVDQAPLCVNCDSKPSLVSIVDTISDFVLDECKPVRFVVASWPEDSKPHADQTLMSVLKNALERNKRHYTQDPESHFAEQEITSYTASDNPPGSRAHQSTAGKRVDAGAAPRTGKGACCQTTACASKPPAFKPPAPAHGALPPAPKDTSGAAGSLQERARRLVESSEESENDDDDPIDPESGDSEEDSEVRVRRRTGKEAQEKGDRFRV